jgi:DHA1 family tetracycline resistance protein-like MFS transporter
MAHDANPATWAYYTMLKFGWTERTVGLSLSVVGVAIMTVNALLVAPAIARLGEVRAVVLGFSAMAFGFFAFAFATETWMMFAAIFPFALIGIAQPALRGMMANRVPADAQGELQGAIGSLMSLTMIVSPLIMTQLFGYFSSDAAPLYFPGASFFAAGVLALVALALFVRATRAHGVERQAG